MFIQTQATPNPDSMKFLPEQPMLNEGQIMDFPSAQSAEQHLLASHLFTIEGVQRVLIAHNFIAITKQAELEWRQIKPDIFGAMIDFFSSGASVTQTENILAPKKENKIEEEEEREVISDDPATAEKIKELLQTHVRPAVARDGGDITLARLHKSVAYLNMRGSCSGCPSSMATLKLGVEKLLRHYLPHLLSVEEEGTTIDLTEGLPENMTETMLQNMPSPFTNTNYDPTRSR